MVRKSKKLKKDKRGEDMNDNINHDHMINCKRIETAIRRAKKMLVDEAKENGLYENFGSNEVRLIKDKFINISDYSSEMNSKRDTLNNFDLWCRNVTIKDI